MKRSEEFVEIIKGLRATQGSLKAVTKDRVNPFAESSYATLDAILAELLPKLNENKIFMTQEPIFNEDERGLSIGIETTLFHESGQWLSYEPFFMILEKGSKMNMAQSAGSVITYAKRYAVGAIFGISTDEDKDGINSDLDKAKKDNKKNGYGQKDYTKKDEYKKNDDYKKNDSKKDENTIPLTLINAQNHVIEFGKHKGKTLQELGEKEGGYLRWLINNSKDDWIVSAVKMVGAEIKRKKEADTHNQTVDIPSDPVDDGSQYQQYNDDPNQKNPEFEGVEYTDDDIPF